LPGRLAAADADAVLVTTCDEQEEALDAIRTAHQSAAAPIVALGNDANVDDIRALMRAGAREFVDINRVREELPEVLSKIETAGDSKAKRGKLISIFSPSGGVGVSTTAVNLAVRLAGEMPGRVALLDLKPGPSDLALMLDIHPKHTTNGICRAWTRMDRRMLASAMTMHGSGLHVLPQDGYPDEGSVPPSELSVAAIRRLCAITGRLHAATVLDTDSQLDECQIEAMRLSTLLGMVVRPDITGLNRARWALSMLTDQGISRDRFRLVLNRVGQAGQVDPATVEQTLGIEIFQRIPEDSVSVNRAVNRGIPVTELYKSSRIGRSFSSFAQSVQTS
jgi:pilus assembly protein CpaE